MIIIMMMMMMRVNITNVNVDQSTPLMHNERAAVSSSLMPKFSLRA